MVKARGRRKAPAKPAVASKALVRRAVRGEVRKLVREAQRAQRADVSRVTRAARTPAVPAPRTTPTLQRDPAPRKVTRADIDRVDRIRAEARARRLPILLWAWTILAALAAWGAHATVAAAAGPAPAAWTALGAGTLVAAVSAIVVAVKSSQLADPRWRRRVWAGIVAAVLTVTAAGMWGPSLQLLGFTMAADWILSALWWSHHRPAMGPPPAADPHVETYRDDLNYYTDQFVYYLARNGKPFSGAELRDGHYRRHGEIVAAADNPTSCAWTLQLEPGTFGIAGVLSRMEALSTGLRADAAKVLVDHHPLQPGESRDPSRLLLQVVINSPIEETVWWREPMCDGASVGLGPYADGDGWAQVGLYTENSWWPVTVLGSIGSGKSALINGLVASARAGMPVVTIHIDGKGGMSSPELSEHATITVTQRSEFRKFAHALERLAEYRKVLQASLGNSGFRLSAQLPAILIVIDECHIWFSDPVITGIFVDIMTQMRSLGIGVILASQYSGLEVYGGKEQIRSSACTGTIIGMRCTSRIARYLLHEDLGDLRQIPVGGGWAYAVGQQATRQTMFRAAHLPSRQDNPDGFNSAVALAEHPDAPIDRGSMLALGEEWFAGDARAMEQQAQREARIAYLTGGWRNDIDTGGSAHPTVRRPGGLPARVDNPEPPPVSSSESSQEWARPTPPEDRFTVTTAQLVQLIEDAVNAHKRGITAKEIVFLLGMKAGDVDKVGVYLGRLVNRKKIRRLSRGVYGPLETSGE